jgi:hypothetical protein
VNRRKFQRQPISLSALVHPHQGRSWLCTIRDFCEEGMLLTGAGGPKSLSSTGAQPEAGDEVALHFSVATPHGQKHYRTQASIARLLDSGNGMGVLFDTGMPDDAFGSLIEFAIASGMLSRSAANNGGSDTLDDGADSAVVSTQASVVDETTIPEELFKDRRISDDDAAEVRIRISRVTQRALDRVCTQFFGIVDNELLVKARDAGTNAVQMMYFEGLEVIEKNRDQIRHDFIGGALKQIDQVSELEDVGAPASPGNRQRDDQTRNS